MLLVILIGFAAGVHGPAQRFRAHARQPLRETVAWIRAQAPQAVTATFGVSDRQTLSYDPKVRVLEKSADLGEAARAAAAAQQPLFVYFCGETESARRRAELMDALKNGLREAGAPAASFSKAAEFSGHEAMFSYQIWRLAP
jgi:hypothetical protein